MKYLRRGVWYLAGRLLVLCLVFGTAITVFYYAMNVSNIQIILKDGMASRAKIIMGIEEDAAELEKYFQSGQLSADEQLLAAQNGQSPYEAYRVRGIDHRLELKYFWLWPWDNAVQVSIHETIPRIDGRVRGNRADEIIAQYGDAAVYPPDWPETDYSATLVRENGQWRIRELQRLVKE